MRRGGPGTGTSDRSAEEPYISSANEREVHVSRGSEISVSRLLSR